MTLSRLIAAMDGAGIELDAGAIMDAIWLAEYAPTLPPQPVMPTSELPIPLIEERSSKPEIALPSEPLRPPRPNEDMLIGQAPLFAGAEAGSSGQPVSPIQIAGAPALANHLAFMRAMRPLRQRWPSTHEFDVDEEATAHGTAEYQAAGGRGLIPALRPHYEPWFDVELILEDDEAVELWSDTLRALGQTLRNTGAFRSVREWRLQLPPPRGAELPTASDEMEPLSAQLKPEKPVERTRPMLVAPSGAELPTDALSGGQRRLILFANHGSAWHWRSGAYEKLLRGWGRESSVVLLLLIAADSWVRTPLGEPDGLCRTTRPGVPNGLMDWHANWWAPRADDEKAVAFPMIELTPSSVAQYAATLMGRGQAVPMTLLPQVEELHADEPPKPGDQDYRRRVAVLREVAPEAFELAVLLSLAPFTISVVRLIQETWFGRVDMRALSELFVSGLLVAKGDKMDGTPSGWYTIHPAASAILRRSGRGGDADDIAAVLLQRVSAHIEQLTGRPASSVSFTLDESGEYKLPDWAKPFATIARQLQKAGRRETIAEGAGGPAWQETLNQLRQTRPRSLALLIRLAFTSRTLAESMIDRAVIDQVAECGLIKRGDEGWVFERHALFHMRKIAKKYPLLGMRFLWVGDRPGGNNSLRSQLEEHGAFVYRTLTTASAMEAVMEGFDVIISNMAHGKSSEGGMALLAALKSLTGAPPVIIFTNRFARSEKNRRRAIAAGAILCTNSSSEVTSAVRKIYRVDLNPEPRKPEVLKDETVIGTSSGPFDVFISHSREDGGSAYAIAGALKARGWSVFFDARVRAGENWMQDLGAELDGAKVVLVLWSSVSVHSTFVIGEATRAAAHGTLLPVLIDGTVPPPAFSRFEVVSMFDSGTSQSDAKTNAFENLIGVVEVRIQAANNAASSLQNKPAATAVVGDRLYLEPIHSGNWVHMPENKYEKNSNYTVATRFHLFSSDSPVILLEFLGYHHVRGCSCLPREPELRVNANPAEISGRDYNSLVQPVALPASGAVVLEYTRHFAPPLTVMSAVDCDYGDFEVRMRYRMGGETVEMTSWFELLPGGDMKSITHRREVPVLNDGHLQKLRDEGQLSMQDYKGLMEFDGETRYRVAFSDNLSPHYFDVPDWLRDELRRIVGEPSLDVLRKRYQSGDPA